jgi:hypothetical protein
MLIRPMLVRPMLTTITITMHSMLVRQEVSFHFRVLGLLGPLGLLGANGLLGTNRVPIRSVTGIARPPKRFHECLSKA